MLKIVIQVMQMKGRGCCNRGGMCGSFRLRGGGGGLILTRMMLSLNDQDSLQGVSCHLYASWFIVFRVLQHGTL
jgi:hypothetical protein